MRRIRPWKVLLLAALCCRGFDPPPPALLEAIATRARPTGDLRLRCEVRADTPFLRGDYDAVIIARPGGAPRIRLQMFADVGGKALDLAASRDRIVGRVVGGEQIDVDLRRRESLPYEPLAFVGFTLLDTFAPLAPHRVVGARREGDGWELLLATTHPGLTVTAVVNSLGVRAKTRYHYRGAGWEVTLLAGSWSHRVEGRAFRMEIRVVEEERVERLADELFNPTRSRS